MSNRTARTLIAAALVFVQLPVQASGDAVVVTATRLPTRTSELLNDVTVVEREQIEASGAASLTELLAVQPGIQMTSNGGAGKTASLLIRGAESRHTVVLVDGMRINSATAGDTALQHIPLAQIERIEIVRGPVSSLYGSEAIGGVVQIFTRRGVEGVALQASYGSRNTADLSASVAGAKESLSYAFTLGRFETDGISAIVNPANSGYNRDNDGYRQDNFNGHAELAIAPGHALAANAFYSDSVSRYDNGAATYDHRILQTLSAVGVESKNRLADNWKSSLRLTESTDDSTNHSSATAKSVFKTEQTQWVWQNDLRFAWGEVMAGVERLEQHIASTTNYAIKRRSVDALLFGYQGRLAAHRLQASARRDDNSQFGAKTTGMGYYGYQLSDDWRASLGAGTSFSAPTFNQLYYPSGWGNSALRPERGNNREAMLVWERGERRFSATWFANRVTDLIQYSQSSTPRYQNVQQAKLTGWNLSVQMPLAGWQAQAALDLLDARDADTGKRLPRRAREMLTLGLARDVGPWSIQTEMKASGSRYDDAANTKPLGGYAVFNASLHYRYAPDTTFFARAENLFDKHYELAADYATTRAGLFVGVRHTLK